MNQRKLDLVLKYMKDGWSYAVACSKAGIRYTEVYTIRHENPEFNRAVIEAWNPKTQSMAGLLKEGPISPNRDSQSVKS